jgi:hypothetical protein
LPRPGPRQRGTADHASAATISTSVATAEARLWIASVVTPTRSGSVRQIPAATIPIPAAAMATATTRAPWPGSCDIAAPRASMPMPMLTNAAVITEPYGPLAYSLIR